jgi:hypothetical protein
MHNKDSGRRWLALAAASLCLLAGCSDDPGKDEAPVASLGSAGAPAAPSAAAGDVNDQRPLVRLDATDEEKARLVDEWAECLTKEGGPGFRDPGTGDFKRALLDSKSKPALAACAAKEPEDYDARQARTNPSAYRDNNREWYQCAKEQGYRLTAPDPDTAEFGLTEIGPNGDFDSPKINQCKRQAFAED